MNIIPLIIIFMIAFLVQYLLTFIQVKSFNHFYRNLRQRGRVAIGTKKGSFRAGAIAMFAIDENGIILEGAYMQGVTVLARFKSLQGFEGKDVAQLNKEDCQRLGLQKPVTKAVVEASSNYRILMSGAELEPSSSNFEKMFSRFKKNKKTYLDEE